ncbi:MAG TPA: hypothetical protein ENN29_03320 [Candidatus Hydrogenedentes bacterium]|nr:hypothetical protein [Candidatus Hydrogenedentota bacterium]
MLVVVTISLMAAASQTDALYTRNMPPPDVPTFEVTVKGEAPFFAGLQVDGQWLTDHSIEIEPMAMVVVVVDSPFYDAAPFSIRRKEIALRYEAPAKRRMRLENMWKSNGYTFLETASGWKAVKEADILLAERAKRMTEAAQAPTARRFEAPQLSLEEEAPGALSPGILLLLQLGIILSGVLIGAAALKIILRKDTEWKPLE